MLMVAPNLPSVAPDFASLRQTMVDCQIRTFDVTDQVLLAQLLDIPRELFLPPELSAIAYSDVGLKLKTSIVEDPQRTLLPPLVMHSI